MSIKSILCKHSWTKIGFYEEIDHGIRYSMRKYACTKCHRERYADGRNDPIERKILNESQNLFRGKD